MPTTATRSSPKLAATDFRRGMSVAHGTHHEAQKSSTIADVPSYDATANGVPSNVVARNGGTYSVASALGNAAASSRGRESFSPPGPCSPPPASHPAPAMPMSAAQNKNARFSRALLPLLP